MAGALLPLEVLPHPHPHRPADHGYGVEVFAAPRGVEFEDARYEDFRTSRRRGPELYLWTQSHCLVTTRPLARRPGAHAGDREWPVVARRSGGGTVFHGPGVLCITLLERQPDASIDRAYGRICSLIVDGLRDLGLHAKTGSLPSAPCDGRFNILLDGRKLAGTAALLSPAAGGASVLVHASLTVEGDLGAGVQAVARFERSLGLDTNYAPDCMISLAERVGGIDVSTAAASIRKAYYR